METIDMTEIVLEAYQLADQINQSSEVLRYLEYKKQLKEDPKAQSLIHQFLRKKELYEETKRFGIFHPNYHHAKEEAEEFLNQLTDYPLIKKYIEAEKELDQLLYQVSVLIAKSVSDEILIPSNITGSQAKKRIEGTSRLK